MKKRILFALVLGISFSPSVMASGEINREVANQAGVIIDSNTGKPVKVAQTGLGEGPASDEGIHCPFAPGHNMDKQVASVMGVTSTVGSGSAYAPR